MKGTHNHHKKYTTRIIERDFPDVADLAIYRKSFLQKICELDGIMFEEIEIKDGLAINKKEE